MRVNVTSDLHLNSADCALPGGDLLLLAGDVFEAGAIRRAENESRDTFLLDRYRRFMDVELAKYHTVAYVFGNHEYYKHDYASAKSRIAKYLPDNVHVLDNSYIKVGDVLVWGATMWTDHAGGNPVVRKTCQDMMTDYRVIKWDPGVEKSGVSGHYWTSKFTADDTERLHLESRARLEEFLEAYPNHRTFVMTHHAPSAQSVSEYYRDARYAAINHAYYSELSGLILDHPQLELWAHGHMHSTSDYEVGSCRVVCSPRGYHGYETQADRWEVMKHAALEIEC